MTGKTKVGAEKRAETPKRLRIRAFAQPTGGAGKTTAVVNLAEVINATPGRKAMAIDIDPESATLSHHRGLEPVRIHIMNRRGSEVDLKRYQELFDTLIAGPTRGYTDFLIDAGSSGFRGLMTFLVSQGVVGLLEVGGFEVEIHYLLPANGRKQEAINDLPKVLTAFPQQSVVLWINPVLEEEFLIDGQDFVETELYRRHRERFSAIIRLPHLDTSFRHTFTLLLQHGLTYAEVLAASEEVLRAMVAAVRGGQLPAQKVCTHLPPGLDDSLALSRVSALQQWMAQAIQRAEGVL